MVVTIDIEETSMSMAATHVLYLQYAQRQFIPSTFCGLKFLWKTYLNFMLTR